MRILFAAAVLPALALLILVYRADRSEKEPVGLLFKLLGFGALAALPAMAVELIGDKLLLGIYSEDDIMYNLLFHFVFVAGAEEGFKLLFLRVGSWKNPAFNYRFDGVVYAVFVSLGFALLENILYVFQGGLSTALMRAVTAIPGHACFGVFMGVWYAMAKQHEREGSRAAASWDMLMAFLVPLLLHGLYDYLLTVGTVGAFIIFIVFLIGMFVLAFMMVRRLSRRDTPIG